MIKDTIYYINIQNEIYECKIKHLVACVASYNRKHFENNDFGIKTIVLEIASKGEKKWAYYVQSQFSPTMIYPSVEDAMNKVNNIFLFSGCELHGIPNVYSGKLPDPENGIWETDSKFVYAYGWEWNGLDANKTQVESPSSCELIDLNSCQHLCYDFVTEEYIYNPKQKLYKTEEECKKHNSIKVHRF